MLKWIKINVVSLRKDLKVLVVIDIVFLLLMDLVLRKIPAPFPFFAKVGDVLVVLAISFLASVIFYFVQVHLPKEKEIADLYPLLAARFKSIIEAEKSILTSLLGLSLDEMSVESIKEYTRKKDLYSDAPLILGDTQGDHRANWMEYSLYEVQKIDKDWGMMMQYSSYLDSECMALLNGMQTPGTLLDLIRRMFPMYKAKSHPMTFGSGSEMTFISFWHFIKNQEDYFNRVFLPYKDTGMNV